VPSTEVTYPIGKSGMPEQWLLPMAGTRSKTNIRGKTSRHLQQIDKQQHTLQENAQEEAMLQLSQIMTQAKQQPQLGPPLFLFLS